MIEDGATRQYDVPNLQQIRSNLIIPPARGGESC